MFRLITQRNVDRISEHGGEGVKVDVICGYTCLVDDTQPALIRGEEGHHAIAQWFMSRFARSIFNIVFGFDESQERFVGHVMCDADDEIWIEVVVVICAKNANGIRLAIWVSLPPEDELSAPLE